MQHNTEQCSGKRTRNCQNDRFDRIHTVKIWNRFYQIRRSNGPHFQKQRNPLCGKCRKYTWHQRGIIHHTNTDHFHWKYNRRHRCPEKCWKCGTHTCQNDDLLVTLIQMQIFRTYISYTCSKLKCCTLSSGRSSKQMCDRCRYQDQWCHPSRNLFLIRPDYCQNQVRSGVLLLPGNFVQPDDQKTS